MRILSETQRPNIHSSRGMAWPSYLVQQGRANPLRSWSFVAPGLLIGRLEAARRTEYRVHFTETP